MSSLEIPAGFGISNKKDLKLMQLPESLSYPKRAEIKAIEGIGGEQVHEELENQWSRWIFSTGMFREFPGKAQPWNLEVREEKKL